MEIICLKSKHSNICKNTEKIKAQSKEAGQMMMHQMLELSSHMIRGACTANGNPLSIKGKYGILLVSGTPINSPGSSCPSGCNMQYTFGGVGVHNQLNGKVFVVDALNNGKLSQANGTTLAEKYWPAGISKLPVNAGDSCTAIAKTAPSTTDGSVSGNEVGDAEPTPPSPPTPTNPTPPTERTEVGDAEPTPPTESTTPTPSPTEDDCPKYTSNMVCVNYGAFSCYMHNGSGWSGRSFTFDLSSPVPERYPQSAQKLFRYILSYGKCPGINGEGYMGVGFLCKEVNRNNLQVNDKCSAVTGKK